MDGQGTAAVPQKPTGKQLKLMHANVLTVAACIVSNALVFGVASPAEEGGSQVNGEDQFGTLASPPSPTFSIWGIIFGWQITFLVAQYGRCCCGRMAVADIMEITPSILASQLSLTLYAVVMIVIADPIARLVSASIVIACSLGTLIHMTWKLRSYSPRSAFFWYSFGFLVEAGWLVPATYVQWSTMFVALGLPMNELQIPFLVLTLVCVCAISLLPTFKYPPSFFIVLMYTFTFQSAIDQERPGVDENYTVGVRNAYWSICLVLAPLSLLGAIYTFWRKAALPIEEHALAEIAGTGESQETNQVTTAAQIDVQHGGEVDVQHGSEVKAAPIGASVPPAPATVTDF